MPGSVCPQRQNSRIGSASCFTCSTSFSHEGYSATSGANVYRTDLSLETIRLCHVVHHLLPEDPEVSGLLALVLLTSARRPTRTEPGGELVTVAEHDRSLWYVAYIKEGVELVTEALRRGSLGHTRSSPPSPRSMIKLRASRRPIASRSWLCTGRHRLQAVWACLLEMAGDLAHACDSYIAAAERAPNLAQQRYLNAQAARLMR